MKVNVNEYKKLPAKKEINKEIISLISKTNLSREEQQPKLENVIRLIKETGDYFKIISFSTEKMKVVFKLFKESSEPEFRFYVYLYRGNRVVEKYQDVSRFNKPGLLKITNIVSLYVSKMVKP